MVVVMGVVGERRRRRGDRHFFAGLGDRMMGRCAFCSSAAFLASAVNVLGIEGERELGYEAYIIHTSPWSSQILHKTQRLLKSR